MTRKKLPIGIQTFAKIREENCYYVDKTPLIQRLITGGTHYFLSRPRRFGKSRLLDTIAEVFEGNQALFKGLDIEDKNGIGVVPLLVSSCSPPNELVLIYWSSNGGACKHSGKSFLKKSQQRWREV